MLGVGFCLGATNISTVKVSNYGGKVQVIEADSRMHDGSPQKLLKHYLGQEDYAASDRVAVTGRKFRKLVNLPTISEPEAVEVAYNFLKKNYSAADVIISAGGETFILYELDQQGKIVNVFTGNKCASGTGEFFLQQIARMDLDIETALTIAAAQEEMYLVSGRCSVFCKSDCTHALNKGENKGKVVAGLCKMMATKVTELLENTQGKRVWLVGGTSKNTIMINYLKQEVKQLIVPEEAPYFEALGAALWSLSLSQKTIVVADVLFRANKSSFSFLPPLRDYENRVIFKTMLKKDIQEGDRCILGLDVGSTTTKAVIMRVSDNSLLASVYLRTNGDPVAAARNCYFSLAEQVKSQIEIIGLGVTGSGRQIAGLHALTDGVINEIIAHSTAAVYFDPEVDTIFEIGGQDAKYTYITNMVPSDYAMNEACSAGTGSFLEESAKESLGLETETIAELALAGGKPPNFNDQCAAFISSDIKNAIQEGIRTEDVVAGLVYSVCMNYDHRVKGNRSVGKKIFMQGGVCYNRAVPIAMAALTGKKIIVPPEPGLMGAYGVALETKNKLKLGLIKEKRFNLKQLAAREISYEKSFVCSGGSENCDRKCRIALIKINGHNYPFGGACNKYVNMVQKKNNSLEGQDLVRLREKLVFEKYAGKPVAGLELTGKKIGLCKSLLTNTLYPLYSNFFSELGLEVVLADKIDPDGVDKRGAAFCYPVEISHGLISDLLKRNDLDYIFLPHVKGLAVENSIPISFTCPLVQGETYYLKSAFGLNDNPRVFSPVLDFTRGYEVMTTEFINLAKQLGFSSFQGESAYKKAVSVQLQYFQEAEELGKQAIEQLEQEPNKIGLVVFGRPYNAFVKEANMGIPKKITSRGYLAIPCDFLPYGGEQPQERMYWSMGQIILKAAKYVKRHPQLFGLYITNFSCGPDSFIITYFRELMGRKPLLTLELDSHTADAGLDTRIEAFLDVINSYLQLTKYDRGQGETRQLFTPASVIYGKQLKVRDSAGKIYSFKDQKVHSLLPSMGDLGVRMLAAALRNAGIRATTVAPPGEEELKIGRAYASCKECLPLILTVGSFIKYLQERKDEEELLVYYMPEAPDPCRFGQYSVFLESIINKHQIKNVAILTLTSGNSYAGFGWSFLLRAWCSVIISDVMDEIYSSILALAKDKQSALATYYKCCKRIISSAERDSWKLLRRVLWEVAEELRKIPLLESYAEACKVALVGEIYVRRDGFSRQFLVEKLAEKRIIIKTAPVHEWVYYCDYLIKNDLSEKCTSKDKLRVKVETIFKIKYEKQIKTILAHSGLYKYNLLEVDKLISRVEHLISPHLSGEAVLTIGTAITEILEDVVGVISIGPFGCMPSRVSEAVIGKTINREKKKESINNELLTDLLQDNPYLPFLAIESDGNIFPQVIEARLEAFCLQVDRINKDFLKLKESSNKKRAKTAFK